MADDTTLPGTGDVVAMDEIVGVKFQRIKMIHGADGVNAGDVSVLNPFPVQTVVSHSSPAVDAHGRLRVSNAATLFDSTLQYDLQRVYWEDVLTGSATVTHNANASCADLTVTADAADSVIRQTREYYRYQPGKSLLTLMSFVFGAPTSGVTKTLGMYDDENGIYFQQTAAGGYQFGRRSKVTGSVVDTTVAQASWNLDPLDGSGPSGITGDPSKANILVVDLQWLSVGRVRVGFEFDGQVVYAHEFLHAGVISTPYMSTANLPLRYELSTDGTNGDTFIAICSTVMSEGGFEAGRGNLFSTSNGATLINVTTRRPIISIRPKATFNSIANRGLILPSDVSFFTQDKQAFFEIVYGGTLTGAAYSSVNDDSIVERDVAATAITGGIVVGSVATDKKASVDLNVGNRYPMFLNKVAGHPTSPYSDCLTIVVTSIETATDCEGTLSWKEIR